MRVLVACEYSGRVRDAFLNLGHDAWSCDLLESESTSTDERASRHLNGAVQQFLHDEWDLMIAHPPCTYLSVAGARWMKTDPTRKRKQEDALEFVQTLMEAPIPMICVENPVSVISTQIRKPDQIIQPWQFGHGETKATCLWLKNLPKLVPTDIVEGREAKIHRMAPGPNRWKDRSRTYLGIAQAMASQWGVL
jgi:site-specific DNA-cytosine methylase